MREANVTSSNEQVDNAQAIVKDTTIRFDAGTVAHYDVIQRADPTYKRRAGAESPRATTLTFRWKP